MSANKIAETSTSTGTGNFTLAGAWSVPSSFITGNRTFNSFYGLNHRFPYMIQDQQGNWEKGAGYLSGATTLVRERVIDNSVGTTALVNFTAGDKLVMVPTDAGADLNLTARENAGYAGSAFAFQSAGTATTGVSRITFIPLLLKRPMAATGLSFTITAGAASSKVRVGIYQISNLGSANVIFSLVLDAGEIDASTTGEKIITASAKLGAGLYYSAIVCGASNSATVRSQSTCIDIGIGRPEDAVPTQGFYKDGETTAINALPTTLTVSGGSVSQNSQMPRVFVRGEFL